MTNISTGARIGSSLKAELFLQSGEQVRRIGIGGGGASGGVQVSWNA